MANIVVMRDFLSENATNSVRLAQYRYDDEDSVFNAPTLVYTHGRNIPLTALVCAYRAAYLGQYSGPKKPQEFRTGMLMYLRDTGICHGEEFGRWYSEFHLDAVLWAKAIAVKHGHTDVVVAADDWLLSFGGWIALALGPRPCGEKKDALYDDKPGPHKMMCDLPMTDEKKLSYARGVSGCVHFGARSWKKDRASGHWLHTDSGFLYRSVRTILRSVPAGARATLVAASKNDPAALVQCWEWASKRIPRKQHYVFARWSGGIAFWLPKTVAAQTCAGTLALVFFEPTKTFDTLVLVGSYKGYSGQFEERIGGERPTAMCEFDGQAFTVRGNWPDTRWPIRVQRPPGELIAWIETDRGKPVRVEVGGRDLSAGVTEQPAEDDTPITEEPETTPSTTPSPGAAAIDLRRWFPPAGDRIFAAYTDSGDPAAAPGSFACFYPTAYPNLWMWLKGKPTSRVWGIEGIVLDEAAGWFRWGFEQQPPEYRTVWRGRDLMGNDRWPTTLPADGSSREFDSRFAIWSEGWLGQTGEFFDFWSNPTKARVRYLGFRDFPGIGSVELFEAVDVMGSVEEGYQFGISQGRPIGCVAWVKYESGVLVGGGRRANAVAEVTDAGRRFCCLPDGRSLGDVLMAGGQGAPATNVRPATQPTGYQTAPQPAPPPREKPSWIERMGL